MAHNLKILLDLIVARTAFAQIHLMYQLCPFLDQETLLKVTHTLANWTTTNAACGDAFKHLEDTDAPKCSSMSNSNHIAVRPGNTIS